MAHRPKTWVAPLEAIKGCEGIVAIKIRLHCVEPGALGFSWGVRVQGLGGMKFTEVCVLATM